MALCQRCICRYCHRNVGVFFLRGLGVALRRHERTCEAARHFLNQEADRAEEKGDAPSQVEPNVAPSRVDVVKQPDRPDDLDTCGPPSQPSRPAHKVYLYMYDLFGGRSIGRIFLTTMLVCHTAWNFLPRIPRQKVPGRMAHKHRCRMAKQLL